MVPTRFLCALQPRCVCQVGKQVQWPTTPGDISHNHGVICISQRPLSLHPPPTTQNRSTTGREGLALLPRQTWPWLSPKQRCVALIQGLESQEALPSAHPGLVEAHQAFELPVGDAGRPLREREGGVVEHRYTRTQMAPAFLPWAVRQPQALPSQRGRFW